MEGELGTGTQKREKVGEELLPKDCKRHGCYDLWDLSRVTFKNTLRLNDLMGQKLSGVISGGCVNTLASTTMPK